MGCSTNRKRKSGCCTGEPPADKSCLVHLVHLGLVHLDQTKLNVQFWREIDSLNSPRGDGLRVAGLLPNTARES